MDKQTISGKDGASVSLLVEGGETFTYTFEGKDYSIEYCDDGGYEVSGNKPFPTAHFVGEEEGQENIAFDKAEAYLFDQIKFSE